MIEVLNPNSSAKMTEAIAESCRSTGIAPERWRVDRLCAAPSSIETGDDVELARRLVKRRGSAASALIIACHADPGVADARTAHPLVLGIGETSMRAAASAFSSFGVMTVSDAAAERKRAALSAYGLLEKCAALEATGRSPLDGLRPDADPRPYLDAAARIVRAGAGGIVLGCAGMAPLRELISRSVGVPVIDPVAVTLDLASRLVGRDEGAEDQRPFA